MAFVADRQILAEDKFKVAASLGYHVGLIIITAAQIRAQQYLSAEDILSLHLYRVALNVGRHSAPQFGADNEAVRPLY